jgi:hypothetical protein
MKSIFRKESAFHATLICTIVVIIVTVLAWWAEYYIFLQVNDGLPSKHLMIINSFYSGIGLAIAIGTPPIIWKLVNYLVKQKIANYLFERRNNKYLVASGVGTSDEQTQSN